MLTKEDKKDIKKIFNDGLDQFSRDILKPAFDSMATKDDIANMATKDDIKKIKEELQTKPSTTLMNNRFDRMEDRMKEQIADPSFKRDQKLNEKTNEVALKLEKKKVFSDDDTKDIMKITPVPAGV
ncbi:MAG: hypothetical protein ABIJ91_04260 [Candidatus Kuenenbacteria bacterium]